MTFAVKYLLCVPAGWETYISREFHELQEGLAKFMSDKGFSSVQEIVGKSLPYFSTHMDLVKLMKEAKRHKAGEAARDNEWAQKDITEKTAELTSN